MAEPKRVRDAFDIYWRMGEDRTLDRLRDELAKLGRTYGRRTIAEWSRRHQWQARLDQLERAAAEAERAAQVRETREMHQRQAKVGLLLQQRGTERLSGLDAEDMSVPAAIHAVTVGAKLERIARGEPNEPQTVTHDYNPILQRLQERVQELTDDELRQLTEGVTSLGGADETGSH
jgi:hypothetical protein